MAIIKIKNPAIDLDAAEIPNLPASKITSGTLDNARISLDAAEIPNLDTAKITTGTLADARVPNLNASKITAGTIATARLGSGTANSSTFLRGDNTFAEVTSPDVVLLASSGSLTSGSRFNADNIFSSTYKSYKIIGTNLRPSGDYALAFIFRTGGASGSDTSQNRYNFVHYRVERNSGGTASALTVTDWNGSVGRISQDIESDDINKTGSFEFQVFDPYATKSTNWINHTIQWDSSGSWIANIMGGGTYNYEAALTGIGIYPSSGNFVNGEIKIYGFK